MRSNRSLPMCTVICIFFFFSCATAYKPSGIRGGYSETKIQEAIYKVSFKGNALVDEEKAADYALLRAAEVTLQNGYRYFAIISRNTRSQAYQYTTPVTGTTSGQISNQGPVTQFNATSYYSGGNTYTFYRPSSTFLIQCFRKKPKMTNALMFDANEVRNSVRTRYKIRGE